MNFAVRPAAVSAYGKVVYQQRDHMQQAKTYVQKNTAIQAGQGGWLDDLLGIHDRIVSQVENGFSRVWTLADSCGSELTKTVSFYKNKDHDTAERLDNTYKPVGVTRDRRGAVDTDIRETENPGDHLKPPGEPQEPGKPFPEAILDEINSWLSPYSWYAKLLNVFGLTDPAAQLAQNIAGDWTAYEKCASVWTSVGQFYAAVGGNINRGSGQLDNSWSGNAADQARDYFSKLGNKLILEIPQTYDELSNEYKVTANGVRSLANEISGLISGMIDDAFWIGVEAAAGGVSIETVAGPVVLWSLAALRCKSFIDRFTKAQKLLTDFNKVANRFTAATGTAAKLLTSLQNVSLPKPYDHPSAK
jgi:hypothetical protein